jgi:hypothetical protein
MSPNLPIAGLGSPSPLGQMLDEAFVRQPYIHATAHGSYRHWWERQTKDAWQTWGGHFGCGRREASAQEVVHCLYPHLAPERPKKQRYRYTRNPDHLARLPWVEHTVVLPCGEEVAWTWQNPHGRDFRRHWRDCRVGVEVRDFFRQPHSKGVSDPGRAPDSLDREEKTRDFRRCSRGFYGGRRKTWHKVHDNRKDRRYVREALRTGRYDDVPTSQDWVDRWKWD